MHKAVRTVSITRRKTVQEEQALRMRRLGMSFTSHMINVLIVLYCWLQDIITLAVFLVFLISCLAINAVFAFLIKSGRNLSLKDPSMTMWQMMVAALPTVFVMFHIDEGQARTIFLLIAVVPMLYGILALKTREFIIVAAWFYGLYSLVVAGIWFTRPDALDDNLEIMQLGAYLLVITEVTLIGGFISSLRGKLRQRNEELAEAMAQINELVNIDALTGVYNRRRLEEVIDEESSRYQRSPVPFSLCLLDIDHFKYVNDTYGHHCGDIILKTIAQSIAGNLRAADCFGRYGGEEFLLVLPATAASEASKKAERIRHAVQRIQFPDIEKSLQVTVSIGVAEYHGAEASEETLKRADKALYVAKGAGRNTVITAADDRRIDARQRAWRQQK